MGWLQNMYNELGGVRQHFNPASEGKAANWALEETNGGTTNNVGERVGASTTTTEFYAVEWEPERVEAMRPGAGDEEADLQLHVEDGVLAVGDRVIRQADSTPFRVTGIEDLGGSVWDIGQVATLEELED